MNIESIVRKYYGLYEVLKDDTDYWWRLVITEDRSPYYRRMAIRSTITFIEGILFGLKQQIVDMQKIGMVVMKWKERSFLDDEVYGINDKGEVETKKLKIDLPSNFLFTIKLLARAYGKEILLEKSDQEWKNFISLIKIRDRITHPKYAEEYFINDNEILLANRVYCWFNDLVNNITSRDNSDQKIEP